MVEITTKRDINLRIRFKTNELAETWRNNPAHPRFKLLRSALSKHRFTLLDQLARFRALDADPNGDPEKKGMVSRVLASENRTNYYARVFVLGMEKRGAVYDRLTVDENVKSLIRELKASGLQDIIDVQGFAYPETKYQVRLVLTDEFSKVVSEEGDDSTAKLLHVIELLDEGAQELLNGLKLSASTQWDNFKAFVDEAEAAGEESGLKDWTQRVMDTPGKKEYYTKTLVLHVDGKEMNGPDVASKLRDAFNTLAGTEIIERVKIASDNPANNPQAPRHEM